MRKKLPDWVERTSRKTDDRQQVRKILEEIAREELDRMAEKNAKEMKLIEIEREYKEIIKAQEALEKLEEEIVVKPKRLKPPKSPSKEYRAVWRTVDGAIKKALDAHPDYLSSIGARYRTARMSIAKRVTGDIVSYLERKSPRQNSPGGKSSGC